MLNHTGLKLVVLSVSLLGVIGAASACDKHKKPADQQTKVALASDAGAKTAETPSNATVSTTTVTTNSKATETTTAAAAPVAPKGNTATSVVSADPNAKIQVLEFVLTNQIVAREPKEVVESYGPDNRVAYAFARLSSKENSQVTFLWFHADKEHSRFTTNVQPASKFRTNASIKLRSGQWKVQLLSDGQVLAERAFTVE